MKLLIVKNIHREGPGLLQEICRERGISHDIIELSAGGRLMPQPEHRAVVVLGGPASANETTPAMTDTIGAISGIVDSGIPYLGICLGVQMMVKARGGDVVVSDQKEVGWSADGQPHMIYPTEKGRIDPLFAGLSLPAPVFHLHGETIIPNSAMTLLATGTVCRNQVVRIGDCAYGLQGHPELTPEMHLCWLKEDPDLADLDHAALLREYELIRKGYEDNGRKLLTNFLRIAGLIMAE